MIISNVRQFPQSFSLIVMKGRGSQTHKKSNKYEHRFVGCQISFKINSSTSEKQVVLRAFSHYLILTSLSKYKSIGH